MDQCVFEDHGEGRSAALEGRWDTATKHLYSNCDSSVLCMTKWPSLYLSIYLSLYLSIYLSKLMEINEISSVNIKCRQNIYSLLNVQSQIYDLFFVFLGEENSNRETGETEMETDSEKTRHPPLEPEEWDGPRKCIIWSC